VSKELFDEAIGAVPPSTVDVDAVLDRERRRARVRRVANPWTAAAAGVAAVAVGAALVFVPGGTGGTGGTAVAPGANGTPSAPPSPESCGFDPRPTGPPLSQNPAVVAGRLTPVLKAAVQQRVAAGTQLTAHAEGEYPRGTQHGPLTFYHVFSTPVPKDGACSGGEDYFMAAATTADGPRRGNVWAMVTRLGSVNGPPTECDNPPDGMTGSCNRKTGPHGEVVVESTFTSPGGPTVERSNVTKPDGTGVIVEAQNVAGSAKQDGEPEMPAPPLSLAQLTEVALDPGLTLYP
jgi:hypothetical protein